MLRSMNRQSADSFVNLLSFEYDASPPTPTEVARVKAWMESDCRLAPEAQYAAVTLGVSMGDTMLRERNL